MKTLLIKDSSLGLASGHLALERLRATAAQAGLTLTDNAADAELVLVAGHAVPKDAQLAGKSVALVDVQQALRDPLAAINQAKASAKVWQAAAAVTAPAAAQSTGQKRIVAVTACPTGVAHTFMAAEAIQAEATKRGWWVKVETRGSVGAGNAITPEEVAAADLVIVAADIDVDLAKFAGKPMYRTSTSLALKKTAQELDKAQVEAKTYQPSGNASASTQIVSKEKAGAYR
ncbi:fructose PTS transporter subunit IIB, partial [Serratia sp. Se-PFBMAAmG]|nr:fructose PTS transporter subunit IIB [Serratia sp. Se-PFBMAAmG]